MEIMGEKATKEHFLILMVCNLMGKTDVSISMMLSMCTSKSMHYEFDLHTDEMSPGAFLYERSYVLV